jgi:hypothetical protein
MINVDDTLYWIAASSKATDGLWKLEGYTPVKISNAKRDLQIAQAYNVSNNSYNIDLRSLSMQGATNIIITGVPGYANVPYTSLTANSSDTNPPTNTEAAYQMLCYCVDYQTWWGIRDASDSSVNVWLPTAYYPIQGGTIQNKYLQHVVKAKSGSGQTTAGWFYFETTNPSPAFIDETYNGGTPTSNYITAVVQIQSLEFQTLRRKFMKRLSISMEPIDTAETTSYMYIVYSKDENTGGTPVCRNLVMDNAVKRYYINRLGMARRVQFALVNKSNHAWKVRALELEVAQALH